MYDCGKCRCDCDHIIACSVSRDTVSPHGYLASSQGARERGRYSASRPSHLGGVRDGIRTATSACLAPTSCLTTGAPNRRVARLAVDFVTCADSGHRAARGETWVRTRCIGVLARQWLCSFAHFFISQTSRSSRLFEVMVHRFRCRRGGPKETGESKEHLRLVGKREVLCEGHTLSMVVQVLGLAGWCMRPLSSGRHPY